MLTEYNIPVEDHGAAFDAGSEFCYISGRRWVARAEAGF